MKTRRPLTPAPEARVSRLLNHKPNICIDQMRQEFLVRALAAPEPWGIPGDLDTRPSLHVSLSPLLPAVFTAAAHASIKTSLLSRMMEVS
ncbi:hypothetical protein RRG08_060950 [Elysia crispata]|uniref:Uncharacterized protein n=1 Tax=Elysia crispata TaxID=231223 RepID=A0AAE1E5H3_9GAST|nr:hypothetical protein RRG08_060950 [Elysia crispata]